MVRSEKGGGGPQASDRLTRRALLRGAGSATAGGVLAGGAVARSSEERGGRTTELQGPTQIGLSVNGREVEVEVQPRTTLLSALRNHAEPALTGTKLVCDRGNCGACTVLLDGEPVCACMVLAADAEGREVRTVEGLGSPEALSPLQQSFCDKDALMCGFCTPGFLMSLTALLESNPEAELEEIQSACSGNLCRCGTYPHIFEAARDAGARMQEGGR